VLYCGHADGEPHSSLVTGVGIGRRNSEYCCARHSHHRSSQSHTQSQPAAAQNAIAHDVDLREARPARLKAEAGIFQACCRKRARTSLSNFILLHSLSGARCAGVGVQMGVPALYTGSDIVPATVFARSARQVERRPLITHTEGCIAVRSPTPPKMPAAS